MEPLQEVPMPHMIAAGALVLTLFLLTLKFIKDASSATLILIGIAVVSFILIKYFPSVTEPVIDFLGGDWMSKSTP